MYIWLESENYLTGMSTLYLQLVFFRELVNMATNNNHTFSDTNEGRLLTQYSHTRFMVVEDSPLPSLILRKETQVLGSPF